MVEKVRNESNKKARDVFSSSNEKQEENWKDVTPKEVYVLIGILTAGGEKIIRKRLHLDNMWKINKYSAQLFFTVTVSTDRYNSVF
jgi:hypothetical protein